MNKIKNFIFSEKKLSKAIFSLLVIATFGLIFGPTVFAQFARQDGAAGWGYGYGYGYGYGGGFDGGTIAGYRTTGNANPLVYDYGYGYGYKDTGVTYDATNGYTVTPANMANLVQSGVMVPDGNNIASTTVVSFTDKVTMNVATGTSITIPSGTTFTAGAKGDFSAIAASSTVANLSSDIVSAGAISFGLPNLNLTVNPAITISVNVGSSYDAQTLKVYRRDAAGIWADTGSTCTVASGICSFTTTHLSSFDTGQTYSWNSSSWGTCTSGTQTRTVTCLNGSSQTVADSFCTATKPSTSQSCGISGGGGGGVSPTMCTSVTYGDYTAACFGTYNVRSVLTRTPANCTLTDAQQAALQRDCVTGSVTLPVTEVKGAGLTKEAENTANFIAREKNLVKKINKALAKRLTGRILLQIQEKGQAWYVNPLTETKYLLGSPSDAFALMRKLALGISNKDFASFKNGKAPAKLAGRIILKVQDKGMAYYVNPIDLKMYYLGRPADAFSVMRKLGLGITNANIHQIGIGEVK